MTNKLTDLDTHVKATLGDAVLSSAITRGELTIITTPSENPRSAHSRCATMQAAASRS